MFINPNLVTLYSQVISLYTSRQNMTVPEGHPPVAVKATGSAVIPHIQKAHCTNIGPAYQGFSWFS